MLSVNIACGIKLRVSILVYNGAKCLSIVIMLRGIMLDVNFVSDIMFSVTKLSVIMLNAIVPKNLLMPYLILMFLDAVFLVVCDPLCGICQ